MAQQDGSLPTNNKKNTSKPAYTMLENDKENVSVAKIHTLMKTSQVINLNPDFVTVIIWRDFFFHIFCWRLFKRISLHCDSKSATGHIKVKRKKEVLMVLITDYCFFATFTPGFPPGPLVSRSREFSTFFYKNSILLPMTIIIFYGAVFLLQEQVMTSIRA